MAHTGIDTAAPKIVRGKNWIGMNIPLRWLIATGGFAVIGLLALLGLAAAIAGGDDAAAIFMGAFTAIMFALATGAWLRGVAVSDRRWPSPAELATRWRSDARGLLPPSPMSGARLLALPTAFFMTASLLRRH